MIFIVNKEKDSHKTYGLVIQGASDILCDSINDVTGELTTDKNKYGIGSRAIVIDSGDTYMLSPSRNWVKFGGVSYY